MAVKCHEQMGNYQVALDYLIKNEKMFLDQLFREDFYGRLYQKINDLPKAEDHYETLLQLNSVNYETYYKLIEVKGVQLFDKFGRTQRLSIADENKVFEVLQYYRMGFPKIDAHIRIGLTFLTGKNFEEYLEAFIKPLLIKGVPSVIQDLKELYSNKTKVESIESLLTGYLHSMEKCEKLSPSDREM